MKTINDIIKEGISNDKLWDKLDKLKKELGAEQLLDEICKGISDDEFGRVLKYICDNYNIK